MKAQEKTIEKTAEKEPQVMEQNTGLGEVKIHENVISNLVRRAALAQEGVSRLAGSTLVDNIAEIVGSRRIQDRSILVTMAGDNRVSLEIKLNVLADYNVPQVAQRVQKAVIEMVESKTGMTVTAVNITVQEIEDAEEPETSDDAAPRAPMM